MIAIARALDASGIQWSTWRMDGNLEAAGLTTPEKTPAPGIHAYIAESPDEDGMYLFVVGWDSPATRDQACALMMHATHGDIFEDGDDDTLVFSSSLKRVIYAAEKYMGLMPQKAKD